MKGWCDFSFFCRGWRSWRKRTSSWRRRKKRWNRRIQTSNQGEFHASESHAHSEHLEEGAWGLKGCVACLEGWAGFVWRTRGSVCRSGTRETETALDFSRGMWHCCFTCTTKSWPLYQAGSHVRMLFETRGLVSRRFLFVNVALTSLSRTYFPQCCSAVEAV